MPELPEVETMCRGIAPIVGRTVSTVTTPDCRYRPIRIRPDVATIERSLKGKKITHVYRLGKRVVIHAGEVALILQPKMSGLVILDTPPDAAHVRLCIDFADLARLRLLFWDRRGLGTVELLPSTEIQLRIIHGRLGPDALSIGVDDFIHRMSQTKRPVKVALLDQKLLAGVGNLYASEMLHMAGIHPEKSCAELSPYRLRKLYQAMRSILLDAIEHEGSTLSDGTYRNALNNPGGYQNQHRVYDRTGLTCPNCGLGNIQRIVQAQRSTFYCSRCQR